MQPGDRISTLSAVADTGRVLVSKRVAWLLVAFGVWSWVIWPTFLKNIWADPRSWHHGMTAFFGVHLALTIASLVFGTAIGGYGIRALLVARGRRRASEQQRGLEPHLLEKRPG